MRGWRRWACVLAAAGLAAVGGVAAAAPHRPAAGDEVLEVLPERASPLLADLKRRRALLARLPVDLRAAAAFARAAIGAARATGDPRYLGQAQAALAPWWSEPEPPAEVLLLRATIRQSRHEFAPALADLDRLLGGEPTHVEARLTRASVRAVRGHYADARADCTMLSGRVQELVVVTCAAAAAGPAAHPEAYRRLAAVLARTPTTGPVRAWAETVAGELAARRGETGTAERHLRAALAQDPSDGYAKGALADVLLDAGRPRAVVSLLAGETRNDALLLRLVLAEQALPETQRAYRQHAGWLADRFAAARRRGDEAHLREEARYALFVEGDAVRAVALARRNFGQQREAADVRLLREAAIAAGDAPARELADDWLRAHPPGRPERGAPT